MKMKASVTNLLVVFLTLFPGIASGEEAACSSPNTLICASGDNLANCTGGRESACWSDNGLPPAELSNGTNWFVKAGAAAAGPGMFVGEPARGTTGPGYTQFGFADQTEVTARVYFKFDGGRLSYIVGGHGPGILGGAPGCAVQETFEMRGNLPYFYRSSSCGIPRDLVPNVVKPLLRNGKWYRLDMYRKMDDFCTDQNSSTGCNGIHKTWIDDQLVFDYNNVNYGGVKNNARFNGAWGTRYYNHSRTEEWTPKIYFDNWVIQSGNAYIGAASNQNADLGTADSFSPYFTYMSIEPNVGQHPGTDCSGSNKPLSYNLVDDDWPVESGSNSEINSGRLSLSTEQVHNSVGSTCTPAPTNAARKIHLTDSAYPRSGVYTSRAGDNVSWMPTQHVFYGWTYLPSSSGISGGPAFNGFLSYKCKAVSGGCNGSEKYNRYIAPAVVNGHWAVKQRDIDADDTVDANRYFVNESAVNFTRNQWHEYEFTVYNDGKYSLMVNRTMVFDRVAASRPIDWMFDDTASPGGAGLLQGVIDGVAPGDLPFDMFFDDESAGSVSFWRCDLSWNPLVCPFAAPGSVISFKNGKSRGFVLRLY